MSTNGQAVGPCKSSGRRKKGEMGGKKMNNEIAILRREGQKTLMVGNAFEKESVPAAAASHETFFSCARAREFALKSDILHRNKEIRKLGRKTVH
jgi:hypothetical protein